MEQALKIYYDRGAAPKLVGIAIKELESGDPLSDNVREYLVEALRTFLDAISNEGRQSGHPGKRLSAALGYKAPNKHIKADYTVVAEAIEQSLPPGVTEPTTAIFIAVGRRFDISGATARNYYQDYLDDKKLFAKINALVAAPKK